MYYDKLYAIPHRYLTNSQYSGNINKGKYIVLHNAQAYIIIGNIAKQQEHNTMSETDFTYNQQPTQQPFHTTGEVAQQAQELQQTVVKGTFQNNLYAVLNTGRHEVTPEGLFNIIYVGAEEISDMVGVTLVTVNNRLAKYRRIKIGNKWVWERTPELKEFIDAWIVTRKHGGM